MRTLVIGATGLVGGAAADALEAFGDEVGQAFVRAVHGIETGKIIALDGR